MKLIISNVLFLFFTLALDANVSAQTDSVNNQGICFDTSLSWQQIRNKARIEEKGIFVDCYASWCVPCKEMEKFVYSSSRVGKFFQEKFINIKLQLDTSEKDSKEVKERYKDAHFFKENYSINVFPTLLFFTADGQLIYRNEGALDANGLLKLASDVNDPAKNYYKLLQDYQNGERVSYKMIFLARNALMLKDTFTAQIIAREYINRLKKREWFLKGNIEFLSIFTKRLSDKGFSIFYRYSDTINRIMVEPDYSQKIIHSIIYRNIVANDLQIAHQSSHAPNWEQMYLRIKNRFGTYYAERVITNAKCVWYKKINDFKHYTMNLVSFVDKYVFPNVPMFKNDMGSLQDLILNNYAWSIFQYSNNEKELLRALTWSDRAVMQNPIANWMDTYANILYKLGQIDLAISWEAIANKVDSEDKEIISNLQKMKEGKPTWPAQK